MSKKIVQCKTCGSEVAKSAKICPHCGAKRKKGGIVLPVIVVLLILVIVGSTGGDGDDPAPEKEIQAATPTEQTEPVKIEYTICTVDELADVLESNALKAEQTYQDQYLEVTGRLSVIDSDGEYISLAPMKNPYAFSSVRCDIQDDAQVERVLELSIGDNVTVRGQITEIGEILGYVLDIDEFA